MTEDLADRLAMITGASRGIGRATALALAQAGCHLALVARDRDALEAVAAECRACGVTAVVITADLAQGEDCQRAVDEARTALGGLHILVNNAGVPGPGRAGEVSPEAWDMAMAVNARAPMDLTALAMPFILAEGWGAVIFIASVAGKMSFGGSAAYCASKHAVVGFAGSLFEDVREQGIKVCAICPGYVNTDMVRTRNLDPDRMIQPDDVAQSVLYVCQSPPSVCPTEIILRPQRSPYR